MFGPATQQQRDDARVERKKRVEEERRTRIFDPHASTKVLDPIALSEQARIKAETKHAERERELAMDNLTENAIKQVDALFALREQEKRAQLAEVQQWNLENSRRRNGSSGIINDDLAPLDPSQFGVSSGQFFQGEDAAAKDRQRRQAQQRKDWAAQQLYEKEEKKRREREMDRLYETKVAQMDQRLEELHDDHERQKADNAAYLRDYNRSLADAKREKEIQDKLNETFNNIQEIKVQQTQSILVEKPESPTLSSTTNRVVRTEFKGMTSDQVRTIRERQEKQRQEHDDLVQKERELQLKWENQSATQQRLIEQRIESMEAQRRDIQRQIAEENRRIAQEQKERNQRRNRELNTNEPGEEFFGQFNTSSR